ncbi:MAG: glycosyltransferase, partial [Bacteroidales bacterium]|nr:glycosyltransferase [Bacteroidales bacterium]
MKVLFVSSGNKRSGISQVVQNQGASLQRQQVNIDYFPVAGKGGWGYIRNIPRLNSMIRKKRYDIIHAHYSLSGFLVTIAAPFKKNIVVSLMGTFRKGTLKYVLVRFLAKYHWKAVIVKSERMKEQIGLEKSILIPNGVELQKFTSLPLRDILRRELGFAADRKYVIFVANPSREEKNFMLCRESVERLGDPSVELQ